MKMKLGSEDRKKTIMASAFGFIAICAVVYEVSQFMGSDTPASAPIPAPAPTVVTGGPKTVVSATGHPANQTTVVRPNAPIPGGPAAMVATSSAPLDPTLHMEAMEATEQLVYSGTGRNIFSAIYTPAAVNIPKPIASARTATVAAPIPIQTGPPPPPPINLSFFGTVTASNGARQAMLLQGENIYVAKAGDTVARRYRIININANTVDVEDLTNSNHQTLPLRTF